MSLPRESQFTVTDLNLSLCFENERGAFVGAEFIKLCLE
jgi:hypothetical protein